ncbi:MAG: hypothetical protein IKE08_08990 [Clostridia bacterium]|nr:hypothetical protein [Clostridia bacterium]MBR2663223.1 hypothetical protein [Clostridia bacterium]
MTNWYDMYTMKMSSMISEDVGVPELRNPKCAAMHQRRSWVARLFGAK